MSVGKEVPHILELPGIPTVWRTTGLPTRRVELPFLASAGRGRSLVLLVLAVPFTLIAWIACPIVLVYAVATFGQDPLKNFEVLGAVLMLIPVLPILTEAILLARRVACHRGYHFGFDAEKLWHFQLRDPIPVASIKRLDVFQGDKPTALRITTGQPLVLQFRSLFNRRRVPARKGGNSQFTISVGMLSVDHDLLVDAICHLVEANGGVVQRKGSLWL
jgi:hypothetical protein